MRMCRPAGVTHSAASRSGRQIISPVSGHLTQRLSGASRLAPTSLRTPGRDAGEPAPARGLVLRSRACRSLIPSRAPRGPPRASARPRRRERAGAGSRPARRFGLDDIDQGRADHRRVGDAGDGRRLVGRADAEAHRHREAADLARPGDGGGDDGRVRRLAARHAGDGDVVEKAARAIGHDLQPLGVGGRRRQSHEVDAGRVGGVGQRPGLFRRAIDDDQRRRRPRPPRPARRAPGRGSAAG